MNALFTLVWFLTYARLAPVAPADLPATAPATRPQQQIFLLHLPGIGGLMRIDKLLTGGLKTGGLGGADVIVYDWTSGNPGLAALGAIQRNKEEAKKIARMIEQRVRAHPQTRIVITGHSGGSGLAVWALEELPDDVQVDTLVMLAPALSPNYDLSRALRHVKNKAYAFNSEYDPVLGPGTRTFGTIDRIMTNAAGRVGFEKPVGADDQQYAKLVQIPYDRGFMLLGNIGDHIGPMMPRFAAKVIAPLILTGELPRPTTQPDTGPTTRPTSSPIGVGS
jgi:pimeloyl-ACP methyl ester carboxylesterase